MSRPSPVLAIRLESNMPLTPQTIQSLRELLAKATPLPWESWGVGRELGWTNLMAELSSVSSPFCRAAHEDDLAFAVAAINALPELLALADSTLRDAAQSEAQAEINALRQKESADDLTAAYMAGSASRMDEIAELKRQLSALQRRTSRHSHAKDLGQAVEGDAAIMARLTAERDDLAKQLTEAKSLLLKLRSHSSKVSADGDFYAAFNHRYLEDIDAFLSPTPVQKETP